MSEEAVLQTRCPKCAAEVMDASTPQCGKCGVFFQKVVIDCPRCQHKAHGWEIKKPGVCPACGAYVQTCAEMLAERDKPDYVRIAGVLSLLIGLFLVYLTIIQPVMHAKPGQLIRFSDLRALLCGEIGIVVGLLAIFFGSRLKEHFERYPKFGAVISIFILLSCILAMELLKQVLRNHGYQVP